MWKFLELLPIFLVLATSAGTAIASQLQCDLQGDCLVPSSEQIGVTFAGTIAECKMECMIHLGCFWYSWDQDSGDVGHACKMYLTCPELTDVVGHHFLTNELGCE